MRRREFIAGLGGVVAWSLSGRAQQRAVPVIGFLNSESPDVSAIRLRGFHQGLREAGYVERQNVVIEYGWANGQYDRLPLLAGDMVRRRVAVIAANAPATLLAKSATTTIPTIFITGGDPVAAGLVASRDLPGGNLTGVMVINSEAEPKRLELLHELAPAATGIAVLVYPSDPDAATNTKNLIEAAGPLGLQLHFLNTATEHDLDAAFATIPQLRVGGLLITSHPFFLGRIDKLAAFVVRHVMPAISQYREFTAAGGLASHGVEAVDVYRLLGVYTGRILKGERPADLPVVQPTSKLVINLKTARALGLPIPPNLLAIADEVIE
jgi:putative tryptophan/tyrosine transport system substrate-binding protein